MNRRFALVLLLCIGLCSACARHKIIPDDKLALIFRDAFLTNAYLSNFPPQQDSLKYYEPIFEKYGYTTEDIHYTIGNFSKRKSARLGDVVEIAIAHLEREGKVHNKAVAILDTVDQVAKRTFSRVVKQDSLIEVKRLKDTASVFFTFAVQPGEYNIEWDYLVDSLDKNKDLTLRTSVWLERADSTQISRYQMTLRRNYEGKFTRRLVVDKSHARLCVKMLSIMEKPRRKENGRYKPAIKAKRPSVQFRNLKIRYTPETKMAVDSLYLQALDLRIFADAFLREIAPADTLSQEILPTDSLSHEIAPTDSLP